ncbi:MAG: hypothetical protein R3F56_03915 [Planctomycetota bacterium]
MTSRKKVHRARRQTMGMLAEAETALGRGEVALARKLIARALEAGAMNAHVHAEAALLLADLGQRGAAEAAARRAEALAPTADFVCRVLVELALPAASSPRRVEPAHASGAHAAVAMVPAGRPWTGDAAWSDLERCGVAVVSEWLTGDEADVLGRLPEAAPEFAAVRPMSTPTGSLECAVFAGEGLPVLSALLADAYAAARELAAARAAGLGMRGQFVAACPIAPPHVERAVRLSLRDGASLPPRADRGGRDSFPLRACLALGPVPVRLQLVDLRPGRLRQRAVLVPPRAAAWFCARERPVRVGDVLGLQPVAWGLEADGEAALVLTSWLDVSTCA